MSEAHVHMIHAVSLKAVNVSRENQMTDVFGASVKVYSAW